MMPADLTVPALIREADSLSELAGQINAAHDAGEEADKVPLRTHQPPRTGG